MTRDALAEQYLSLLKKSLLDELYLENEARLYYLFWKLMFEGCGDLDKLIIEYVNLRHTKIYQKLLETRAKGGWMSISDPNATGAPREFTPARNIVFVAHSMIGRPRMDNIHACMNRIVADGIPGDVIETGVWKGGATIFMRGFLKAHGITDRKVWVADSFEGLPPPTRPEDAGHDLSASVFPYLAVCEEDVRELFERYDLLDKQVRFLKGWFKDTLPKAPIRKLALLRLDGDLYESTMDALAHLYHKLSPGGFVIIDDYNHFLPCKQAVSEFRKRNGIRDRLQKIDPYSVFWRKSA